MNIRQICSVAAIALSFLLLTEPAYSFAGAYCMSGSICTCGSQCEGGNEFENLYNTVDGCPDGPQNLGYDDVENLTINKVPWQKRDILFNRYPPRL